MSKKYLDKTGLGLLWDEIENLFKQKELELNELRNNQIHLTTEKASNINFQDCSGQNAKIGVFGISEQKTRSGKNVFNKTAEDFKNGATVGFAKKITLNLKPSKNYTCSTNDPINLSSTTTNLLFGNSSNGVNKTTPRTFSADELGNIDIFLRTEKIDEFYENYYIQVEEGDIATSFEQYGASPSPEFKSDIENAGDNIQLLNNNWKKCSTSGGYPVIMADTENSVTITSNNTEELIFSSTDIYRGIASDFIAVKSGEQYTISFDSYKDINRMYIEQYDENKLRVSSLDVNTALVSSKTVTATQNGYIVIAFANTETKNDMRVNKVKFEKGTKATSYSPYNCGNVDITSCNKNLFNIDMIDKNGYLLSANGEYVSSSQEWGRWRICC